MTATLFASAAEREFSPTEVRILTAALALIGRRGVRRLAMQEISEAAGVSRATLYRYFPSKEDVLAAAADPQERIAAFMSYSFSFIRSHSARSLFESEPGYVLGYLLDHLPSLREELLVRLGDDLGAVPAVAAGDLDREQLADLIVRLFAASWIVPESDDASLVKSVNRILHIAPEDTR